MSARTRRRLRRREGTDHDPAPLVERWHRAEEIRDEWLRYGLGTDPADRDRAEAAITGLYRTVGRDRPHFIWTASPREAAQRVPDGVVQARLRFDELTDRSAPWHVAAELAGELFRLRERLDARIGRPAEPPWWSTAHRIAGTRPAPDALAAGIDLADVLDVGVDESLRRSLRDAVRAPVQAALAEEFGEPPSLRWYGQHDAYWVARYDVRRRLRPGLFGDADDQRLDLWADTVRSCGWWWPRDRVCVVAERTTAVHTEAAPAGPYGEVRTHHADGPAVRYPDGTGGYAWHGTAVPSWVIRDPTVERISMERNVEIRRCAIERIGWDVYVDRAGLSLVASAPDPGNPGCELRLYDMNHRFWQLRGRVLLAVNGSVERDGTRRRYGLAVPGTISDPVAAAGWSYGLSGEQYARLLRRT